MSRMTKVQFARDLRQRQTEIEKLLWFHLRSRKLNGLKFKRQEVIKPYIVDFACYEAMIIVEADGGQHNTPEKIVYDKARTKYLENLGWLVLRYWDNEIGNHLFDVLENIYSKDIPRIQTSTSPHPLLKGEGEIIK